MTLKILNLTIMKDEDLTHEIDHLWQKVKANETEPMDAINHLECKLNRLALTLHLSILPEPIEEVFAAICKHFMYCTKENVLCKHFTTRYHDFQW